MCICIGNRLDKNSNSDIHLVILNTDRSRKFSTQVIPIPWSSKRQRKCLKYGSYHAFPIPFFSGKSCFVFDVQDQEMALVDAISRLAYTSDGESGNKYMCT